MSRPHPPPSKSTRRVPTLVNGLPTHSPLLLLKHQPKWEELPADSEHRPVAFLSSCACAWVLSVCCMFSLCVCAACALRVCAACSVCALCDVLCVHTLVRVHPLTQPRGASQVGGLAGGLVAFNVVWQLLATEQPLPLAGPGGASGGSQDKAGTSGEQQAERGGVSRRRDCHSAAPPSTFSRCFNRDKKGVSS